MTRSSDTPAESPDRRIELQGSLWMTINGASLGGKGRVALLAHIAECGSITHAAKAMHMSYKAAWDAIDAMNNLAGEPLVAKAAGGKGGGGTRLTARGERLLENFRRIEREHRRFVEQLSSESEGIADDLLLIRRMGMKTSVRNQYLGKVTRIARGAVNDEIELQLPGDLKIVAIITHESTESLGLSIGVEAFALVKASSVIVATDVQDARFSARNCLAGRVLEVRPGAVNDEVVIELDGGTGIAAIITHESACALALAPGMSAWAMFKASSVILGVPA